MQANTNGTIALAQLLGGWKELRSTLPLWSGDIAPSEKQSVILDCEYQLRQLEKLEHQLANLDNPACEMMLQGVRIDQRRLRTILSQRGCDQ